jgi:hypothetical protein
VKAVLDRIDGQLFCQPAPAEKIEPTFVLDVRLVAELVRQETRGYEAELTARTMIPCHPPTGRQN